MISKWLIGGAAAGCMAGALAGACSSTSKAPTGNGGGGNTATSTSASSAASTSSSGSGGGGASVTSSSTGSGGMGAGGAGETGGSGGIGGSTSNGTGGSGGAAQCSNPGTLHPPKLDAGPGSIYCPFSGVDGGPNEYCIPASEHCCETPAGAIPSGCDPIGTACGVGSGYTDWQCEDPIADCTLPNGDCCAPGATLELGGVVNGKTCGNYAKGMTKAICVPLGSCVGIQLCTSDNECPAGKTCTPFTKSGNQVGGCL